MMILLGEWIAEEGFVMEQSRMALARRIQTTASHKDWALLRHFSGLAPTFGMSWELLKTYTGRDEAQKDLEEIEEGMWRAGFTTTPLFIPDNPRDHYSTVPSYGLF